MAHQWRGVIREYAARLPMLEGAPVVTLQEGGTPLIPCESLSDLTVELRKRVVSVEVVVQDLLLRCAGGRASCPCAVVVEVGMDEPVALSVQ